MPTLREIINTNYCGIDEDINQIELAVIDWLKAKRREIGTDSWTALSKVDTINDLLKEFSVGGKT